MAGVRTYNTSRFLKKLLSSSRNGMLLQFGFNIAPAVSDQTAVPFAKLDLGQQPPLAAVLQRSCCDTEQAQGRCIFPVMCARPQPSPGGAGVVPRGKSFPRSTRQSMFDNVRQRSVIPNRILFKRTSQFR